MEKGVYGKKENVRWRRAKERAIKTGWMWSDVPACSAVTLRADPTHPDHKETQPHLTHRKTHTSVVFSMHQLWNYVRYSPMWKKKYTHFFKRELIMKITDFKRKLFSVWTACNVFWTMKCMNENVIWLNINLSSN